MEDNQFRILIHAIADNLNALVLGIGAIHDDLQLVHNTFRRMAEAAEAQVAETQSMRMLVELQQSREEN